MSISPTDKPRLGLNTTQEVSRLQSYLLPPPPPPLQEVFWLLNFSLSLNLWEVAVPPLPLLPAEVFALNLNLILNLFVAALPLLPLPVEVSLSTSPEISMADHNILRQATCPQEAPPLLPLPLHPVEAFPSSTLTLVLNLNLILNLSVAAQPLLPLHPAEVSP